MTTPTGSAPVETPAAAPAVTPEGATPAGGVEPRTLSIPSLVAAIASIPLGQFILLPVAAIVLGFLARAGEPAGRTLSTWGMDLGFVILFGWVDDGAVAATIWLPFAFLHRGF